METPPSTERTGPQKGDVIDGSYQIDAILAEGTTSTVVSATDRETGTKVAVKIARAGDLESIERFRRAARAMERLKSPFTVRVISVGETQDDLPCMSMEYLEGKTLALTLLQRGALPIEDAVRWIKQTCESVAEAHTKGFLHRDLDAENLFLAVPPRGLVGPPSIRVLDYGLSPMWRTNQAEGRLKPGEVPGTSLALAPELVRGGDLDVRVDIWGIGVCLYRLLTNKYPFAARNLAELCAKLLAERAPDVTRLRPDVTPALAAIVKRCLEREPEDRFPSVRSLIVALDEAEDAAPYTPHVPTERAFLDDLRESDLRETPMSLVAAPESDDPPTGVIPWGSAPNPAEPLGRSAALQPAGVIPWGSAPNPAEPLGRSAALQPAGVIPWGSAPNPAEPLGRSAALQPAGVIPWGSAPNPAEPLGRSAALQPAGVIPWGSAPNPAEPLGRSAALQPAGFLAAPMPPTVDDEELLKLTPQTMRIAPPLSEDEPADGPQTQPLGRLSPFAELPRFRAPPESVELTPSSGELSIAPQLVPVSEKFVTPRAPRPELPKVSAFMAAQETLPPPGAPPMKFGSTQAMAGPSAPPMKFGSTQAMAGPSAPPPQMSPGPSAPPPQMSLEPSPGLGPSAPPMVFEGAPRTLAMPEPSPRAQHAPAPTPRERPSQPATPLVDDVSFAIEEAPRKKRGVVIPLLFVFGIAASIAVGLYVAKATVAKPVESAAVVTPSVTVVATATESFTVTPAPPDSAPPLPEADAASTEPVAKTEPSSTHHHHPTIVRPTTTTTATTAPAAPPSAAHTGSVYDPSVYDPK